MNSQLLNKRPLFKLFLQNLEFIRKNKIDIYQNREEFFWLWKQIKNINPKNYLEIGCLSGGTLYPISQLCSKSGIIIGIDFPNKGWGRNDSFEKLKMVQQELLLNQYNCHLIIGNSQSDVVKSQLRELLHNELLDVLFIDGDHSYEGVKHDYDYYIKYVKPGGIIVFHDINNYTNDKKLGVPKFWSEIKTQYKNSKEVIIMCGIGIVYK